MVGAAQPESTRGQSGYFGDLDGMRGILALSVVLLHLGFNSFAERKLGWLGLHFDLAVDVFFLLSGFVLTMSARRETSLPRFAFRRFLRLAPVFYVTTLIALLASNQPWHPLELLLAMPLAGLAPANFPAWSICWELYLPILAFAMGRTGLRVPDWLVLPLLAICLVVLGLLDVGVVKGQDLGGLRAVFGLLGGHLIFRSGLTVRMRPELPFAGILLVMALASYWPGAALALPVCAALAIMAGLGGNSVFSSWPMKFLGDISYTVYLVHVPLLLVFARFLGPEIDGNAVAKIMVLLCSIAGAWALTKGLEQPVTRWSKRFKDPRPA